MSPLVAQSIREGLRVDDFGLVVSLATPGPTGGAGAAVAAAVLLEGVLAAQEVVVRFRAAAELLVLQ